MLNIIKEKLDLSPELKKKIVWAKNYTSTSITLEEGHLIRLEPTNLSYIESHRIIIKGITFLAFNYSTDIYIRNLTKKIKISDLEDYLNTIQ